MAIMTSAKYGLYFLALAVIVAGKISLQRF